MEITRVHFIDPTGYGVSDCNRGIQNWEGIICFDKSAMMVPSPTSAEFHSFTRVGMKETQSTLHRTCTAGLTRLSLCLTSRHSGMHLLISPLHGWNSPPHRHSAPRSQHQLSSLGNSGNTYPPASEDEFQKKRFRIPFVPSIGALPLANVHRELLDQEYRGAIFPKAPPGLVFRSPDRLTKPQTQVQHQFVRLRHSQDSVETRTSL